MRQPHHHHHHHHHHHVILELCCGWKSTSVVFKEDHGWDAVTLDLLPRFKPTILADITTWDYRSYFQTHPAPDVIWASPPCRTFTVAAWGKNRTANGEALTEASEQGDACVRACLDCIEYCRAHVNPNVIFFVENPGYGAFRKLPCVVPYIHSGQSRMLQYGDYAPDTHSLKPTIVLTNCTSWHPRPMRLTKSVVHWNRLSKKRRTVIPRAVCEEVAAAAVAAVVQ